MSFLDNILLITEAKKKPSYWKGFWRGFNCFSFMYSPVRKYKTIEEADITRCAWKMVGDSLRTSMETSKKELGLL